MKISIKVFDLLDNIAKSHRLKDNQWALACNLRRPTIPELRRISRASARGIIDPGIKRSCTLEKVLTLYAGLCTNVGSVIVNEALTNYLDSESDQNIRLQILVLILKNAGQGIKSEAEAILRVIIKST